MKSSPRVRPFSFTSTLCLTLVLVVSLINHPGTPLKSDLTIKPAASFSFNNRELCLMERINKVRARHGLNKLRKDPQVGYVARVHAITIARAGTIFHDATFGQKLTNWSSAGQNTGRSRTCQLMVRSFMHDQVHKDVILGPWRWQGAGVKKGRDGKFYFQHLFTSGGDPGTTLNMP
jgi:uncharacterized protein YkwD